MSSIWCGIIGVNNEICASISFLAHDSPSEHADEGDSESKI